MSDGSFPIIHKQQRTFIALKQCDCGELYQHVFPIFRIEGLPEVSIWEKVLFASA